MFVLLVVTINMYYDLARDDLLILVDKVRLYMYQSDI